MKTLTTALVTLALSGIPAAAAAGDTDRAETIRKLETLKISVDFDNVKLAEAVDYLRDATRLNLLILPRALEKDADGPVKLKVRDLAVKSVLKLLLHTRGLTATWRDGALVILPREDLQDTVTMRLFDVRALMITIQDFPGPKIELVAPGATYQGPGIIVDMVAEPNQPIGEDLLLALVKENTGGNSWDSNPKAAISLVNGMLVVSQSPSVHREIEKLLGRLGQFQ